MTGNLAVLVLQRMAGTEDRQIAKQALNIIGTSYMYNGPS